MITINGEGLNLVEGSVEDHKRGLAATAKGLTDMRLMAATDGSARADGYTLQRPTEDPFLLAGCQPCKPDRVLMGGAPRKRSSLLA